MTEASYTSTSLDPLRQLEPVDRKKMTAVCAKNNLSYKRAMARFIPRERLKQLEANRRHQQEHSSGGEPCSGCVLIWPWWPLQWVACGDAEGPLLPPRMLEPGRVECCRGGVGRRAAQSA